MVDKISAKLVEWWEKNSHKYSEAQVRLVDIDGKSVRAIVLDEESITLKDIDGIRKMGLSVDFDRIGKTVRVYEEPYTEQVEKGRGSAILTECGIKVL